MSHNNGVEGRRDGGEDESRGGRSGRGNKNPPSKGTSSTLSSNAYYHMEKLVNLFESSSHHGPDVKLKLIASTAPITTDQSLQQMG